MGRCRAVDRLFTVCAQRRRAGRGLHPGAGLVLGHGDLFRDSRLRAARPSHDDVGESRPDLRRRQRTNPARHVSRREAGLDVRREPRRRPRRWLADRGRQRDRQRLHRRRGRGTGATRPEPRFRVSIARARHRLGIRSRGAHSVQEPPVPTAPAAGLAAEHRARGQALGRRGLLVSGAPGQLAFDPRQALFFPEKRPFFLEGSELFQVPQNLIYTRRIVQPVAAVKLTGTSFGTDIGLLSAVDQKFASATGTENPIVTILRAQRSLGRGSPVGLAYTDWIEGGDYNRVAEVDSRLVFKQIYGLNLQLAGSRTRVGGVTTTAPLWLSQFTVQDRIWGFRSLL